MSLNGSNIVGQLYICLYEEIKDLGFLLGLYDWIIIFQKVALSQLWSRNSQILSGSFGAWKSLDSVEIPMDAWTFQSCQKEVLLRRKPHLTADFVAVVWLLWSDSKISVCDKVLPQPYPLGNIWKSYVHVDTYWHTPGISPEQYSLVLCL